MGIQSPTGRGTFRGHVPAHCYVLAYDCIHHCSPDSAGKVPAQRKRRKNVFAAAKGDKTAMQPFVKLLWTLVHCN